MVTRRLAVSFVLSALALAAWPPGRAGMARADSATSASVAAGVVFHDRNGNGRRDPGEEGLPGVRVSNQHEVVQTDANGQWRLPVTDDTIFFVIKPRGWMTPVDERTRLPRFYYIHKPHGSPKLECPGVEPTGPLPSSIDFPLRPRNEPDRFRAILFGDPQARDEKEVEYLAHDVVEELVGTDAALGITLGDIINQDDISLFESHNSVVGLIGIPWYNVIGNHNANSEVTDDALSDETFERFYGPNYYSFDHGRVHFIVMDDILWTGAHSARGARYKPAFGPRQLEFVKNDLSFVPEDSLIVLLMHVPLTDLRDREALYRLIEKRPYTLSFSGHTHSQEYRFITRDKGWQGAEPHCHLIAGAAGGSKWAGPLDDMGLPYATMKDGAPNGYFIVSFDGHRAAIEFKAARKPADYQMNIYAPEAVSSAEAARTEVLVNVFAGSERSKVEMRLGADGPWLPMTRVDGQDPILARLKASQDAKQAMPGKELPKPGASPHFWSAKLPDALRVGMTLIHVRTTDMFGKTYQASRAIRIR
jgi:hypothetical protein